MADAAAAACVDDVEEPAENDDGDARVDEAILIIPSDDLD